MNYQLDQAYESLVFSIFFSKPRGVDEQYILETIRKVNKRPEKEDEMLEGVLDKINELVNEELIREEKSKNPTLNPNRSMTMNLCWSLTGQGFETLKEWTSAVS